MLYNDDDFEVYPNTDGVVDSQHFMTFDMPDDGTDAVDMLVEQLQQFREQIRRDYPNTRWVKGKVAFGRSDGPISRVPSIRIEMRGRRRAA